MGKNFTLKKVTLTHKEANQFVDAVVDSAFNIGLNENEEPFFQYDPLAQLTAIKLNICKFYGDMEIDKLDEDELYEMCCDIEIEDLKGKIVIGKPDFNYVQLNDIIKASEMKIDYLKQNLLEQSIDKRSSLDRLIDEIGDILIPFLKKLTNIGEIDSDMINKFAERFANEDFDITPENLVNAVLNSKDNNSNDTSSASVDNQKNIVFLDDQKKSE